MKHAEIKITPSSGSLSFGERVHQIVFDACNQMPQDIVAQSAIYKQAGNEAMKTALAAGREKAIELIKLYYYINPASAGGAFNFSTFKSDSVKLSQCKMKISPTVGAHAGGGYFEMKLGFAGEHTLLNSWSLQPGSPNSTKADEVSVRIKKNDSKHTLRSAFIRTPVPKKRRKGRRWLGQVDKAGLPAPETQMFKIKNYPKRSVFVVSQHERRNKRPTRERFKKIGTSRRSVVWLDRDAEQLRQLVGPRLDQLALSGVTPSKGEHSIMNQVADRMCEVLAGSIEKSLERAILHPGGQ